MLFQLRIRRWAVAFAVSVFGLSLRMDATIESSSVAPFPAIVALARAEQIPLEGYDAAREQPTLRAGDRVAVLFTLIEGAERQQWLADIRIVPLNEEERRAKPREDAIYTATGNEYRLRSAPAAFALRMFGPVREREAPTTRGREKTARFLVQEDYLSFGWDRMGELALRLREVGQEIRLGVATGKFSDDQIAKGKKWAEETKFTLEDERVCVHQGFAQIEFLKLADRTPGFRDIAKASLDLPSIFTALITRKFGMWFSYDWKNLRRLEGSDYGLPPNSAVYALPFGLTAFGKHVANGTWLATAARPPLLTSAGVIGLSIGPPDNREKRLELRVIAARNGAAPAVVAASTTPTAP